MNKDTCTTLDRLQKLPLGCVVKVKKISILPYKVTTNMVQYTVLLNKDLYFNKRIHNVQRGTKYSL